MILNPMPRQIVFLMIFMTGLGFLMTEGETGDFSKILPITSFFVFPPLLLSSLVLNRQMWPTSKKNYIKESLRDACLCSLVVALFIPTINRIIPPSTDYNIDGKVAEVTPCKDGRNWRLEINQKNGEVVNITVPRPQFPSVAVGDHVQLPVKRGGLGNLYGPKK